VPAAVLAGVPWWVVLMIAIAGLAVPFSAEVRAWCRERQQRRSQRAYEEALHAAIREIPDANERIQALLKYRQTEKSVEEPSATSGAEPPPQQPAQDSG
jgi:hypothetical protein